MIIIIIEIVVALPFAFHANLISMPSLLVSFAFLFTRCVWRLGVAVAPHFTVALPLDSMDQTGRATLGSPFSILGPSPILGLPYIVIPFPAVGTVYC